MIPDGPGYAARSDVGLQRTGNEDRYLALPPLFAVADGMGGHQAGEVASGLAIGLLEQTASLTPSPGVDSVVETIERSNAAIRQEARLRSDLAGMGTTCTVVVIDGGFHVAHVGDSRAYRLRDGQLVQLTDDHSLVASMVREGIIAPADAMTDGRRNIITRALGAEDQVRVDLVAADRVAGDRLLVCSDGLHGQVDDAEIATVLRDEPDPGRAADRLVDLANTAGGDDNVTVIVIDPDALAELAPAPAPVAAPPTAATIVADEPDAIAKTGPPPASGAEPASPRRGMRPLVLLVILLLAAVVVAVGGWLVAGTTISV